MKILHVLASNAFSGAENVACQIIEQGRKQGIVSAYTSVDGTIKEVLDERQILFYPLKKMTVYQLHKVIVQFKPDIIHAHDMRAGFVSALCKGKIPLVSHIHNSNLNSRGLTIKSILYFYAAYKAKKILWVSKQAMESYYFINCFRDKSSVLENVVNVENILKMRDSDLQNYPYQVVYLGRIAYPKNPQRLVKIISIMKKEITDIKVAIIGVGEQEYEIKRLVCELGLVKNVFFLGFRKNPFKILSDSRVMLLTSRWEGLPMCVMEALTLGVPVVSTDLECIQKYVINGVTGYLSNNDMVIANHAAEIVKNEQHHNKLSDFCTRESIKWNDQEKYMRYLLNMWTECLK